VCGFGADVAFAMAWAPFSDNQSCQKDRYVMFLIDAELDGGAALGAVL
jgi:hypothetical protein